MSSEKHQNDAVLKIYEVHKESPENIIYKLKDKADDNKPSYIACIIHASSLGYIQGVENRRHSVLFQGFRNAVDALKLMHL